MQATEHFKHIEFKPTYSNPSVIDCLDRFLPGLKTRFYQDSEVSVTTTVTTGLSVVMEASNSEHSTTHNQTGAIGNYKFKKKYFDKSVYG